MAKNDPLEDIKRELEKLEKENMVLKKDTNANLEFMKLQRELENPKLDQLDMLIDNYNSAYDNLMKISNIYDDIEIVQKVKMAFEENKDKRINKIMNVEGQLPLPVSLQILGYNSDRYKELAVMDVQRLKSELRLAGEKKAENIKAMMITKIPLDEELLLKMDFEERTKAFQGVFLESVRKVKEVFKYRNIPELDAHLALMQPYIDILDLGLQMAMVYQAVLDSSNPLDEGLINKEEEIKREINEQKRTYESNKDRLSLQETQIKLNGEKISLQMQEIQLKEDRKNILDEQVKSIEATIKAREREAEDEDESETGEDE